MESNMEDQNRARKNIKTKGGGLQAEAKRPRSMDEFWARVHREQAQLGPLAQKIVALFAIARQAKKINKKTRAGLRDHRKLLTLIDHGAMIFGMNRSRFIRQAFPNPTGGANS
jgi:hypothetical protein